ncbi:MAG: adventurous gliding motility protein GltJ [Myxococcus sp.]|nr:adventurous gliding motility protein GltJ [Myxococcus sp.]
MRFVCESCRAQYMINDEKVGPKGVKVRCRKCGYVIHVKRTDGGATGAAGKGPVGASNDPEDATATQVMNSPLAAGADATLDLTSPGAPAADPPTSRVNMNDPAVLAAMDAKAAKTAAAKSSASAPPAAAKPGDSFLGADEDEIGAVFDSVLAGGSTGPTTLPTASRDSGAVEGDRESTKVLDADMVKRLAEESNASPSSSNPALAKVEEVPQQDWYVALNDKQTGPMPLDQLKQHWDTGEVGPDSLCWRAGFSDWIPVSEVKILAAVLAPKPAKPIVVAPPVNVSVGMMAPSVVSVPVQSAFSAGGLVTTVQSEMQVPIAASSPPSPNIATQEDTGTWRPSAASALASLVKEETDFLAKPAARKQEAPPPEPASGGLLDLPSEERAAPAPQHAPEAAPARPAPPPVNPYLANQGATYSAPAVTQYRPPSNRGLIIGLGVGGGVLLICLIGLVLFLALREPKVVVAPQPIAVAPVQPPPVAVAPTQPAPTQPTQPQPPTQPVAPVAAVTPPVEQPAPAQPVAAVVKTTPTAKGGSTTKTVARAEKPEPAPAPVAEKKEPAKSGGDGDSFDDLFGDGKKRPVKEEASAQPEKKKPTVYVPPPPGGAGGGDLKDELNQSDILEVVSGSKAALGRCAEEQRKREPGTTGRLVMKWSIQTSGKVSNVGVVTEEFKGTYMAGCVGGVIKAMTFPRHKKAGEPVQFPFKF